MYQLTLQLKPVNKKQPKLIPGILTKRFHAFVLSSIQQQNPSLSSWLHKPKQRQQFSFYVNEPLIVLNSPKKEVILSLRDCWQQEELIDLHSWKATIQQIALRYIPLEEMQRAYRPNITLYFHTPTTFYQEGNYYPLPEINRLLLSANKIYPMMDQPMVTLEQINRIARIIRIENLAIQCKRVHFGKFSVIGFQGKLELNLKALTSNQQSIAWMLLSLGSQLGFGYKTAWGLGQVQLTTC